MSIFNGNSLFLSKKSKTMPVVKVPKNVKQSLQIDRAFENGIFKIEPKEKMAVYDRCYIFEDINYINKNIGEQNDFLMNLMFWLNSMDVEFKITLANEYQSMEEFWSLFVQKRIKQSIRILQMESDSGRMKESRKPIRM